jgi:hypothetical protein
MRGDGSKKERVSMTSSEILKALSQGHERWPGDALEAAPIATFKGQFASA